MAIRFWTLGFEICKGINLLCFKLLAGQYVIAATRTKTNVDTVMLNTDHTDIFNAPNTDVIDATSVIIHWKSILVQNMEIGYSLSCIFFNGIHFYPQGMTLKYCYLAASRLGNLFSRIFKIGAGVRMCLFINLRKF